ncbi:hypothetical protein [Bradyrhizobium sp. 170]|uniref:hypothetical protein n=1 Tax=Bradyrhizobium sp. 170 TaxID=2782641 RepID=UPI00200038BA|nr:hypothetical protein [Bradyrhizobium sp. 170]UPK07623.1 hypothetical protein IVB05_20190 [Bradyrhizobium sp. 170]
MRWPVESPTGPWLLASARDEAGDVGGAPPELCYVWASSEGTATILGIRSSTQGVIVFDTAEDEHVVSVEHIGDDGENGENGNGG